MPQNFDLIVFDWDGTLMDSAGAIVASIQGACLDLGLAVPSEQASRHIIGLGLTEAIAQLLPSLPQADYPKLVERYRHHFLSQDADIPLFEGAERIVRDLHQAGFLLGVATGKSRHGLDRVLEQTGLGPYFHGTRCADECFSKPHPEMLEQLMDELGAARPRTLMIGDTSHDLQMAQNAGVAALAVSYGAHPRAELLTHAPLACLDRMGELEQWLLANA
jgi:phosphoglycolate phosphatase